MDDGKIKTNLQLLQEALQQECNRLEEEITRHVAAWEFYEAENLTEAFYLLKNKLTLLRNLANPHQQKIEELNARVVRLQKYLSRPELPEERIDYFYEQIQSIKNTIEELRAQENKPHTDGDQILTFLEKLTTGEIEQFELILRNEVSIEIQTKVAALRIEVKRLDGGDLRNSLSFLGSTHLKTMGFTFTINHTTAHTTIATFSAKEIVPVLELLAGLVFDVFGSDGTHTAMIKL